MSGLYRSPLRVYLSLALLSFIGLVSAVQLPISLFPNSTKPKITACIGSHQAPDSFLRNYGNDLEEALKSIRRDALEVEKLKASYREGEACFDVDFKWGGGNEEAQREVQAVLNGWIGRLPAESKDQIRVWGNREDGGFLALSFFSRERSLTELHQLMEPVLAPKLSRVSEASEAGLFNPQEKQLMIELRPEALAALQLLPSDVVSAVFRSMESYTGGSISSKSGNVRIEFPRVVKSIDDFRMIQVPVAAGRSVTLNEIARIDLTLPEDKNRIMKVSGAPSLILFASPKPGGNVKSMAEEVRAIVDEAMPSLPKDVEYKVIVDPSEFIRSAVFNVGKEVALAAGLAVIILFLFVGNLKNVATAAIEIPLSLILAFILMRMTGMNLNLISLGGLALSAGMNVDASVVVMENIFRHFELAQNERPGVKLTYEERFQTIVRAVREVQFAVIASTIASLVVFVPLAFTSDLTNAILGDLAKAVVFSHGFSAIVALVLVPTIRLHLMKNGMTHEKPSIFEGPLQRLEAGYSRVLGQFLNSRKAKYTAYSGLALLMALLLTFVVPRLPREIIGKPDTDWLTMYVSTEGNTLTKQMEAQAEEVENELLKKFGDEISYTFLQLSRPNGAFIMFRLKDKRRMNDVMKKVEEAFQSTPTTKYYVDNWNPAELPLPNPPDFEVSVRGVDTHEMAKVARDLEQNLLEKKLFQNVSVEPNPRQQSSIIVRPRTELWPMLQVQGFRMTPTGLADLTRVATVGQSVLRADIAGEEMSVYMRMNRNLVTTPEELGAMPIGVGSRIIPLKALAEVESGLGQVSIERREGRQVFSLTARGKKGEEKQTAEAVEKAKALVNDWPKLQAQAKAKRLASGGAAAGETVTDAGANDVAKAAAVDAVADASGTQATVKPAPTIEIEDPKAELNGALKQLGIAVSLSVLLIFLTMVFQFGSLMNSVLVLVAIPLGFIGVVISLFVFQSTLSLNSLLGVILLNGLAVANSIILVDFLQKKVAEGVEPRKAAVEVARVRLRPILMTSMTTGLGMLPIALGMGEGGKILQPLGIAVAGGLAFSMITTLFIVPALQVSWIEWSTARAARRATQRGEGAEYAT